MSLLRLAKRKKLIDKHLEAEAKAAALENKDAVEKKKVLKEKKG